MTNNVMNFKYTVEEKFVMINKFLDTVQPIEKTLIDRLTMIRKQAIIECNEEKYLGTIIVEREFKHCKLVTIDSIYSSNGIDEAVNKIDSFVNTWIHCDGRIEMSDNFENK